MTADEMFENLGFIKGTDMGQITYSGHGRGDYIVFDLKNKQVRVPKCFRYTPEKDDAVKKFMEEQGWNV